MHETRAVRPESKRLSVRVGWVRRRGSGICDDDSFFGLNGLLVGIVGEGDGGGFAVVEGFGLEEEAEDECDGGKEHIHPVEPREAHVGDDISTCNGAYEGAERQHDRVYGLWTLC